MRMYTDRSLEEQHSTHTQHHRSLQKAAPARHRNPRFHRPNRPAGLLQQVRRPVATGRTPVRGVSAHNQAKTHNRRLDPRMQDALDIHESRYSLLPGQCPIRNIHTVLCHFQNNHQRTQAVPRHVPPPATGTEQRITYSSYRHTTDARVARSTEAFEHMI